MARRGGPAFCDRCGFEIRFDRTEFGKIMPVDIPTYEDGNIVYRDGVVHVLKKGEVVPENTPRFKSHFATCTKRRSTK